MSKKEIYKNLDDVLSFIHDSENEWIYSGDISSSLKQINPKIIHQLLLKLEEDGLIIYKDNSVSRIKLEGIIFHFEKGYQIKYRLEKKEKREERIRFYLLVISGLGVIITIIISSLNYNFTKNQNDVKIHRIENKLDSMSNVLKSNR